MKSTAGFASAGSFTVVGGTGTCNYTSTDSTHFLGITGCKDKPEDKAIVTSTTGSTVNLDQTIDASHTTLNVADGTPFGTTGSFTGTGLSGTCQYTGRSSNQLTGVTGCTGTAKDVTKLTIVNAAGVYKWDDGTKKWVVQAGSRPRHGPSVDGRQPLRRHLFRLAEHEIIAEANAGAGKTDVGIAGAVAINIVTNDKTEALVEGGAHVTASSADVTIKTQATSSTSRRRTARPRTPRSAGVGAAVALNVLTSTETRSEVEDTA